MFADAVLCEEMLKKDAGTVYMIRGRERERDRRNERQ